MVDITRTPLLRHLRSAPTTHVRHLRNGRLVHDGAGAAFWYRPLSAALSEIPIDDRELPLMFHARSQDFQDLTVQATLTFRVADPALAATRIDFSVDPDTGDWRGTPLEQLGGMLSELAQQHTLDVLAAMEMRVAMVEGVPAVRNRIEEGLRGDPRLAETGLTVIGARVVAVRVEPDVERALQTPTRERVQQDADRATYERRAMAVERERAIGENELQTKIELAHREEQLVAQEGQNQRRRAEEQAAAGAISTDAQARRQRLLAESQADATRAIGGAEAEAETARLAAYRDVQAATLLALAAKDLAGHLPEIGSLVITPDLVSSLLARLSGSHGSPTVASLGDSPDQP